MPKFLYECVHVPGPVAAIGYPLGYLASMQGMVKSFKNTREAARNRSSLDLCGMLHRVLLASRATAVAKI